MIPQELRDLPQWILWRNVNGRKLPYQIDGRLAKSNDPATWTDFESAAAEAEAIPAGSGGLGFVFSETDEFFGVDLDGCIGPSGVVEKWATDIVLKLASYSEVSPSGTGVKIFGQGRIPDGLGRKSPVPTGQQFGDKVPAIEAYDRGRYFAVTGEALEWSGQFGPAQSGLDHVLATFFPEAKPPHAAPAKVSSPARADAIHRASLYMLTVDPSISGQGGHNTAFRAACALIIGFGLTIDEAFPIYAEWNESCLPPWNRAELNHKLASADKETGERGYLLGPSYDAGAARSIMSGFGAGPAASEELEASPTTQGKQTSNDAIPDDLMNPCGLLGEVMEWILCNSWIPQREFALSAAIALLCILTGQKIDEPTGERSNLYLMNLGESSSGKEGPVSLAEKLLDSIGLGDLIFSSAASGAGLLSVLRRIAVRLLAWDELGISLKALNDQRAGAWQREIISLLLSLFTRANSTFRGKAYADIEHDSAKAIDQPHLVLLGSSTPATFYGSLSAESVENGLLGRLLMFIGDPLAKANRDLERGPIPESIVDAARKWTERGLNSGDFGKLTPAPVRFRYTDDAARQLRAWGEDLESRKIALTGWRRAMLGRVEQIGKRLALIHAASIGPDSRIIDAESARWGSQLAEFLMGRLARHAAGQIFENAHDKDLGRVVEFIASQVGGATRSDLARAFRGIESRKRDEILKHAIDGGMILGEIVKRGNRDVPVYKALQA